MTFHYNPHAIEPKWQAAWDDAKLFEVPHDVSALAGKPKYYILDMFPYPSGAGLHVGHPEGYTATDVLARMKRMQGFAVLHPMGWDSFGLPAERAAQRDNIHPAIITKRNIDNFRRQIKRLGFSYDWSREVTTSNADYYRWTQWIFLRLYEKGLAYLAEVPVNWCPALGTVLANEEVKDGKYVETGDVVERRLMKQWMLKITAYAERLLTDLDTVDWPDGVKDMQRHWIGKSEGAEITFRVTNSSGDRSRKGPVPVASGVAGDLSPQLVSDARGQAPEGDCPLQVFTVFTTRPDTLFGATYCVLAPEHPLVAQITTDAQRVAVTDYVAKAAQKTDLARTDLAYEKTGVFTGAYAQHPVTGNPLPIWIADYVLVSYGTGAIMAVPAHDERDHAFATLMHLPIAEVISGASVSVSNQAYSGDGTLVNSDFLNGLDVTAAKARMIAWLEEQGKGKGRVQYRLRDWLFSRQRYWGEPFPIVHLDDGTIVPLPDDALPVELPQVDKYQPTEDGAPPLARASEAWLRVTLPDGRTGTREVNTMPQWAGSCWYYLRYLDPSNTREPWSAAAEKFWMPVDLYVGGVEHAVLHLLYARFWHKVLYDCGLVHTIEPFQKLFNQGMILAFSYRDANGKYYHPSQVDTRDGKSFVAGTDTPLVSQIEKMSKSKQNVFNPDDVIAEYGADAMRLYEMFMGPLDQVKPWQMEGVEGVNRFLARVWRLVVNDKDGALQSAIVDQPAASAPALQKLLHQTIQKVTDDTLAMRFNTAIAQMMVFVNAATSAPALPHALMRTFVRVLAPYAPHIAEELWALLGGAGFVAAAEWPVADAALCHNDTVTVVVQVNGKRREAIDVPADATEDTVRAAVLAHPKLAALLSDVTPKKVIYVPKRLINYVVG